jgi:hypothetical protein
MWLWSTCGMILTVKTRSTGERPAPVPLFAPQVSTNTPGSKPGLRCVRLMTNRWSHRRTCSVCVLNFEVYKLTNYHLLASFHFINQVCLIHQFMCWKGVPENIRQVKIFFIFSSYLTRNCLENHVVCQRFRQNHKSQICYSSIAFYIKKPL